MDDCSILKKAFGTQSRALAHLRSVGLHPCVQQIQSLASQAPTGGQRYSVFTAHPAPPSSNPGSAPQLRQRPCRGCRIQQPATPGRSAGFHRPPIANHQSRSAPEDQGRSTLWIAAAPSPGHGPYRRSAAQGIHATAARPRPAPTGAVAKVRIRTERAFEDVERAIQRGCA